MVIIFSLIDSSKSIFDVVDDWNKMLSFIGSIGAVLASVFSLFYIIRSIGLEDHTKYTFKDFSEKDRYMILKSAIITIITTLVSLFLGLSIASIQLLPNLNYNDVLSTYILSGTFFLLMFIVFTYFFKRFPHKFLRAPYYFYKEKTKNYNFLSSAFAKILLIFVYFIMLIIALIPIFILGVKYSFDSIKYIILSSFIYSFYAVSVLLAIVHDEEDVIDVIDVIFAKIFGNICLIIVIIQIPSFIYYIKKIDILNDKIPIKGIFIISCIITLLFFVFNFMYLHEKINSNISRRQALAYFYAKTKNNKKVYIYGKLDDYFLCNEKDYIKCSNIEQKDRIEKIYNFKRKVLKSDFFVNDKLNEKKYKKLYYDLIEDMLYYIKYLDESDNDMIHLFNILDKVVKGEVVLNTITSLDKNLEDIKKIFTRMDKKIKLQFIEISDIKNKTIYYYRKNIKSFKKNF